MSAPVAGAVTAVVGMFFDIPPQYGYMIGAGLWGVTHPTQVEGPKLADLKVITSQYGLPIPNVYGAVRVSGNVIWSTPLVQIGTTDSQKGGQEVTTYKQYARFAMGICEGPIDGYGRIWVNNKLFTTNNSKASIRDILASSRQGTITQYLGTEDQMPDPLIQSFAGVDKTSAYCGLAYLVFDMIEYPSRGLNVEVEVFKNGQKFYVSSNAYNLGDEFMGFYRIGGVFFSSVAQKNQIAYMYGFGNEANWLAGVAEYWSVVLNTDGTYKPLAQILLPSAMNDGMFSTNSKSTDGSILYVGRANLTYKRNYYIAYPDGDVIPLVYYMNNEDFGVNDVISVKDSEYMFMCALNGKDLLNNVQRKIIRFNFEGKYVRGKAEITTDYDVKALALGNNYLFSLDNDGNIRKYDLDMNYIGFVYHNTDVTFNGFTDITTGYDTVYASSGTDIFKIENNTKTFIASTASSGVGATHLFYQNDNFFFNGGFGKLNICAKTTEGYDISVASIVNDLCEKSLLDSSEYDTTLINDLYLRGYVINGVMSTGSAMEQLANYFFFDGYESDDKLKFVARGKKKPIIIPEEDLAAHSSGSEMPDDLAITRKQTLELPQKITVKYMDTDGDYQVCSQFARRYAVDSQNSQTTEAAVVQTGTQARKMADRILRSQWLERRSYQLQLSNKYLYLEPSDVIQTYKDGEKHVMRITEVNYQNDIITINAVAEDIEIYESHVSTASNNYRLSDTVYQPSSSDIKFLDIPLLRDQDDNVGYYVTVNGLEPNNWSGCQVYKSIDDGASFSQYGSFLTKKGIFGLCQTTLGNNPTGFNFENINVLTVKVNGALSSTTTLNVLNGSNVALVGKEIIQFKNAISQGNGVYKLYGLLRGCFGTEQYISTHTNGEEFILLNVNTLYLENSNNQEYGLERMYKALSPSDTLNDALTVKFTNNSVAQMPYAPVHLGGGRDSAGNLLLKWVRRTRINGSWRNNTDVPLGESSEAYIVEIIKNGSVVRTIETTTQSCTYTAAQQTTDFGSVQSSITFNVYQVSSSVGKGFKASKTI